VSKPKRDYKFAILPEKLIVDDRVSWMSKGVWSALLRFAATGDMPERKWLSERMGMSQTSMDRCLAELVATGWSNRTQSGRTYHYEVVSTPMSADGIGDLIGGGRFPRNGDLVDRWVEDHKLPAETQQDDPAPDAQPLTGEGQPLTGEGQHTTGGVPARSIRDTERRRVKDQLLKDGRSPSGAAQDRPRAKGFQAPEEDYGQGTARPSREVSIPDPEPAGPPQRSGADIASAHRARGASRSTVPVASASRPTVPTSAAGLAQYFDREAKRRVPAAARGFGVTNKAALAGSIRKWLDEGVEPEVVARMVELFLTEPPVPGVAPWRAFLAARHRLAPDAQSVFNHAHRTNDSRKPMTIGESLCI
jgi:hypothetical protein